MSTLVHYLAGGALAIMSQAALSDTIGFPNALGVSTVPLSASIQEMAPTIAPAPQQQIVNRTNKGDRLISTFGVAPDSASVDGHRMGNELIARESGAPQIIKPAPALKVTPSLSKRLPEGCNSSVSPLSDRVAANQASNCVTALEVPRKVASAL